MLTRDQTTWISPRQAAKILHVSEMTIYKMALLGRIKSLAEPGANVRFSREDAERLAAEIAAKTA